MAIIKILSENKDLSWVLVKNPESGVSSRSIRQGTGFGWFASDNVTVPLGQQYNLFFKDGEDCDSFSKSDFEYLSQGKFGHPLAHMSLINTFLRDVVKGVSEKDIACNNVVVLDQVNFKGVRLLEHLQAHLSVDMQFESKYDGVYKITFKGDCTLNCLVRNVLITCLFLAGEDGVFLTKLNESFIAKYAGIIQDLDLPYYLRYVFARNYLKSKDQFIKFKSYLEKDGIILQHGNTGFQRLRYIESKLDMQNSILDVGAGEGMYALNLTKRTNMPYHAVDIDEELIESISKKAEARGLDITTYNHINTYEDSKVVDILFIEVVEHMPLTEAEELFTKLLTMKFSKLFITTPDKDFNKHYLLKEGEFRHDDHDWEMNSKEFQTWVNKVVSASGVSGLTLEYVGIGDCVDGVYTSQGYIITNSNVPKQAIITVGCSASGKSTFAESICKSNESWVEVNRDNIRFRNKPKDWTRYKFTKQNEYNVTKKWNAQIDKAITDGNNIIISDTNLNVDRLDRLKTKLENSNYLVTVKVFDVEFEELLKRDNQRLGGVGYEVLLNQYISFRRNVNGIVQYTERPDKPDCYVVDIDGTLSDKGNRSPFDYSKVSEDTLIPHVAHLIKGAWVEGLEIVFMSGREVVCAEDTRSWLVENLGDWTRDCLLLMRSEGDHRKDYHVKMELFDKYVRNNFNVLASIDDRKQVIESCWSVLGVNTICVGNLTERF